MDVGSGVDQLGGAARGGLDGRVRRGRRAPGSPRRRAGGRASGPAPAVTSRAEAQRPPAVPTTMAAIPTMAKSPWRRLNSSKAKPAPSGIAGSRTSTSISSARQRGGEIALEQRGRRERALAPRAPDDHLSAERGERGRVLRRGIGMGEAAADGAARADREMPDQGGRLGQQRQAAADHRRELDRPLARHGPDADVAGVLADVGEGCATRFRSTRAAGRLNRKLRSGTRLCPPASSLASPP